MLLIWPRVAGNLRPVCFLPDLAPDCIPAMSTYFPTADECSRHTIFPGVHIRTCAMDKMMMSFVNLEPGSVDAEHSHPHEQVGMILAGQVIFFIGAEQKSPLPGDMFR